MFLKGNIFDSFGTNYKVKRSVVNLMNNPRKEFSTIKKCAYSLLFFSFFPISTPTPKTAKIIAKKNSI